MELRRAEKKVLFGKITKYIGRRITYKVQVEGWTVTEVADACGLQINRVSEIKNYSNYDRPINETFLAAFIGGGIVTIEDIKKEAGLDEKEVAYISDMSFYEDATLRKTIQAASREGIDVIALINEARKNKEE